jgi:plasmid stabilization system protein ParE
LRLRFTFRALDDLDTISDHVRNRDPAAAKRIRDDLQKALQILAAHPHAGRAYTGGRRRFALRRFPYLIFYRVDKAADQVVILAIRHGARQQER